MTTSRFDDDVNFAAPTPGHLSTTPVAALSTEPAAQWSHQDASAVHGGPAREALRLAAHELLLPGEDLVARLTHAARQGWERVGLLRRSLWQLGEDAAADWLRTSSLRVSTIGWTGGFTGSAGFTYREAIEDGRMAIQEARRIGAQTVLVAPGARGGHTFRHAQRVVGDGLRFLAEIAGRHGVTLAVLTAPQRAWQSRWSSIDTLELAQQLLEVVDSPWVGLAIPASRWADHASARATLRALASRIRVVTSEPLTDLESCNAWGAGAHESTTPRTLDADVVTTLSELVAAGFTGVWELEGPDDPRGGRPGAIDAVRAYEDLAASLVRGAGGRSETPAE